MRKHIAYYVDADGKYISRLRTTQEEIDKRPDLITPDIEPPDNRFGNKDVYWEGGKWVTRDKPAYVEPPAVWNDVKYWRDVHETAPVTTAFGTFDCDERSDARMAGSIEQFDNLPTLDANGKLTWKLADNSYLPVTKAELEQIYAEVRTARASRGAVLHQKAELFMQMDPVPTPTQLAELSYWLV